MPAIDDDKPGRPVGFRSKPMPPCCEQSISEDVIERFSMGRLEEPALAEFEEHLLLCEACQDRVEQMDTLLEALRTVAREPVRRSWLSAFLERIRPHLVIPRPLAGLALAGVAAMAILVFRPAEPLTVAVSLEAMRSEQAATAPAGTNLVLSLAAEGLAPQEYLVRIVGRDRVEYFAASAALEGRDLRVDLGRSLPERDYQVQIYTPEPESELVREYTLRVR